MTAVRICSGFRDYLTARTSLANVWLKLIWGQIPRSLDSAGHPASTGCRPLSLGTKPAAALETCFSPLKRHSDVTALSAFARFAEANRVEHDHDWLNCARWTGCPRSSGMSSGRPTPLKRDAIRDPSRPGESSTLRTAFLKISLASSLVLRCRGLVPSLGHQGQIAQVPTTLGSSLQVVYRNAWRLSCGRIVAAVVRRVVADRRPSSRRTVHGGWESTRSGTFITVTVFRPALSCVRVGNAKHRSRKLGHLGLGANQSASNLIVWLTFSYLSPPQFAAAGNVVHDAPAALRHDSKSPHSSGWSRGLSS